MKTPEEIIALYPGLTQLRLSDIEQASLEMAMKEYAKEWIERACVETRPYFGGYPEGRQVFFERLKQDIDAQ